MLFDLPIALLEIASSEQHLPLVEISLLSLRYRGVHGPERRMCAIDAVDAIDVASRKCHTALLEVATQPASKVSERTQRTFIVPVAPQELVDRILHLIWRLMHLGQALRTHKVARPTQQRVQTLLRQPRSLRLPTDRRKLDIHLHILSWRNDQRSDFQHALPILDISLAALQSLHPSLPYALLLIRIIGMLLIRDDLLQLSEHLHPNNHAISPRVRLPK